MSKDLEKKIDDVKFWVRMIFNFQIIHFLITLDDSTGVGMGVVTVIIPFGVFSLLYWIEERFFG